MLPLWNSVPVIGKAIFFQSHQFPMDKIKFSVKLPDNLKLGVTWTIVLFYYYIDFSSHTTYLILNLKHAFQQHCYLIGKQVN